MKARLGTVIGLVGLLVAALFVIAVPSAEAAVTCEKFGSLTIQGGRYVVQNNVWGADTPQCVDTTTSGFNVTSAGHNKPTNGAPASYPSAYFGCHFGNCSSGSGLPLQASNSAFNGIRTSVAMTYPGSGVWDAAYDIWFDPTARTTGQNTGAEIMVWLNHQGSIQPIGSRVATVGIAGSTWDVWFGNTGWNVVSYVRTSATGSLSFAVNDFYADAISRGLAQRAWFLTSIQAGFEPWVGGAGLAVNSFSVTTGGGGPTTTTTTTTPPPGPAACRVTYAPNTWPGGFTTNITLTNTGSSTINGWTVGFTFPGNQQIGSNRWEATFTQNGTAVTARDVGHNGTLAPGASANFGFQGTYSGTNNSPTAFTANGATCSTA